MGLNNFDMTTYLHIVDLNMASRVDSQDWNVIHDLYDSEINYDDDKTSF